MIVICSGAKAGACSLLYRDWPVCTRMKIHTRVGPIPDPFPCEITGHLEKYVEIDGHEELAGYARGKAEMKAHADRLAEAAEAVVRRYGTGEDPIMGCLDANIYAYREATK